MHLFDSKKGILRPKSGLVFKLTPYLTVFYLGPTPEPWYMLLRPRRVVTFRHSGKLRKIINPPNKKVS
jgi:hypothetical protein